MISTYIAETTKVSLFIYLSLFWIHFLFRFAVYPSNITCLAFLQLSTWSQLWKLIKLRTHCIRPNSLNLKRKLQQMLFFIYSSRLESKSQLISKCPFGVFNSSKKRTRYYSTVSRIFLFVFWKNWRHQKDTSKLTDL